MAVLRWLIHVAVCNHCLFFCRMFDTLSWDGCLLAEVNPYVCGCLLAHETCLWLPSSSSPFLEPIKHLRIPQCLLLHLLFWMLLRSWRCLLLHLLFWIRHNRYEIRYRRAASRPSLFWMLLRIRRCLILHLLFLMRLRIRRCLILHLLFWMRLRIRRCLLLPLLLLYLDEPSPERAIFLLAHAIDHLPAAWLRFHIHECTLCAGSSWIWKCAQCKFSLSQNVSMLYTLAIVNPSSATCRNLGRQQLGSITYLI